MKRPVAVAVTVTISSLIVPSPAAAQQRPAVERLLTLGITAMVSGLIFAESPAARPRPAAQLRFINGPALESATANSAIIRWTTNAGAGPVLHYGVVQYGTDPENLSQTAESLNRWNRSVPYVIYRVRVDGLRPGTTYYYAVGYLQANGILGGLKSAVRQFTTRQRR